MISWEVLDDQLTSDHRAIACSIGMQENISKIRKSRFNTKKANWEIYCIEIEKASRELLKYEITDAEDVEKLAEAVTRTIIQASKRSMKRKNIFQK